MPIHPLDELDMRARINHVITEFIADHRASMSNISPDVLALVDSLSDLMDGGKRLRPAFAYWGYRSTGAPDNDQIIKASASLEFLQACALIHDDVMDDSDTRRGKPAVHKQFTSLHQNHEWRNSSARFGDGSAILVGDLALSWSDELLLTSGFNHEQTSRAKKVFDIMRTELMAGQYLDLLEQVRGNTSVETSRTVIRYKSAKYTIERPLHMGAAIAGANAHHLQVLSDYGLALGEAFQLRDDVLGVFGDAIVTGKPAGDDLREGKETMLVAYTRELASPETLKSFNKLFGLDDLNRDQILELQEIMTTCGALAQIEEQIEALTALALDSLQDATIAPEAREALQLLAIMATKRES